MTEVRDGRVVKTINASWIERVPITKRLTREVPINVTIVIDATERDSSTLLAGTAYGNASLSAFDCRIVRRIAEKRAAAELREGLAAALLGIERGGTGFYRAGASDALTIVRASIDIGANR